MKNRSAPDSAQRSEIIGRLYDVALDPVRYEELLDIWEERLGGVRPGLVDRGQLFKDHEIEAHFSRADTILDRAEPPLEAREAILAEIRTAAAFVVDPSLRVSKVNPAAETWLGIRPAVPLSALPMDTDAIEHLEYTLNRGFAAKGPRTVQLRVQSTRTKRVVLLHIRFLPGSDPFAVVVTSELEWPDTLDMTLADAFGLSPSETSVIRGLVETRTIKEIAKQRGRSVETVRSQLKTIFQKTQTHGQAELIRVCLSLMDIVAVTEAADAPVLTSSRGSARLESRPFQTLMLPDGRRFDYLVLGDASGKPVVYLPLDYGFVRWPATAEAEATRRGLRVVVPVRAGYGSSTSLSRDVSADAYGPTLAADAHQLLDHLQIERCAVLSIGSDSWYAHHLIAHKPDRFSGLLMAAGALPMTRAEQYERMGKWHRFINANARYAPTVFPFMVKAGFALATRIGPRRFLHAVYAGSPADLTTVEEPEVLEAILSGTEVALSKAHSAHSAFSREVIAQTLDWSPIVERCRSVPTVLLIGDQDEHAPPETVNEWETAWPHIRFRRITGAGYLLFFTCWRTVLDQLEKIVD